MDGSGTRYFKVRRITYVTS